MTIHCGKCEHEVKGREKYLECNGFCERAFHQGCAGLSDIAFKVITEKSNVLWSCDVCGIGKTVSLRKVFKDFQGAFEQLSLEIKHQKVEYEGERKISYADKLKGKKSEPVLLIKPKAEGQNSVVTKEEVQTLIDPTDIEISGVKSVSNGGIIIECKNEQAIHKLKEEAQSKLSEKYNINEPKKRKPCVKITGMREHRNSDEIVSKIKAQNKFLESEKAYIKVVHTARMRSFNNRSVRYFAYAEVDPESYQKLMEAEVVNIGWDVCKVYDAVTVTRCFNCCGYNHKAKDCKKDTRCPKCAGNHGVKECNTTDAEPKCVNCEEAVGRLNLRININHAAWDPECPAFKRKLEIERNKVNFLE